MEKEKIKSVFAVIGGLSVILGIILGAMQIYDRFYPNEASLKATVIYRDTSYPTNIIEKLHELNKMIFDSDGITNCLSRCEHCDSKEKVEDFISKLRKDHYNLANRLCDYKSSYVIILTNKGNKACNNIKTNIPESQYIQVVQDGKLVSGSETNITNISEILPNNTVGIQAWSHYGGSYYDAKDITISHNSGVADINILKNEIGGFGRFVDNHSAFVFPICILLALYLLQLGVIFLAKKRSSGDSETTE